MEVASRAGVNLYGRRWQAAARQHVIDNPFCARCGEQVWMGDNERRGPVDHIIPHRGDMELFWDTDNRQTLCETCHSQKTRQEAMIGTCDWRVRDDRIVVWGKACTGKSTFAAQCMTDKAHIVWDMDLEASRLGFADYPRPKSQLRTLIDMRKRWAKRVVDVDIAAVMIVVSGRTAKHFGELLNARLVLMTCPEDERQRRLRERWEGVKH